MTNERMEELAHAAAGMAFRATNESLAAGIFAAMVMQEREKSYFFMGDRTWQTGDPERRSGADNIEHLGGEGTA